MSYSYIMNRSNSITIDGETIIPNEQLLEAIGFCNNALRALYDLNRSFDINIFETLGLRNLSGLVGEYLVKSLERFSNECLHSNPHQDGYPDLLLTNTPERLDYYKTLYNEVDGKKYLIDKNSFSPFKFGGIEVKATCGITPEAKKMPKPLIGEKRINKVKSFDWKAHHRETNNLLSVFWDFIDEVPTIAACFYRNDLIVDDWGSIVKPKSDGGRTTSVSVMKSKGVTKMCKGWLAIIDESDYIDKFSDKKWIGERIR